MAFVRLYSGPDGESHFEEMDMGFAPTDMAPLGSFSPAVARAPVHIIPEKVKRVILGSQTEDNVEGFHTTRQRHYAMYLGGAAEMEASDGVKLRFRPGDLLLHEDTTGKGHRARILDKPWQWCAIMLEEWLAAQL